MSWTSPKTWVAYTLVTASQLNQHMRDNLLALWKGTTAGDMDYYTGATDKARLAAGTAGHVLRMNSGGTAPEWASVSSTTVPFVLQQRIAPLSGIQAAALDLVESSSGATYKPLIYRLSFDDTTDEGAQWIFKIAGAPAGTATLQIGYYMAAANSAKTVKFGASLACISDTDASVTAKAYDTINTQVTTVPEYAGTKDVATITLTNADSLAEGDWCNLLLTRLPSDTVNDTASGDTIVTDVVFIYG